MPDNTNETIGGDESKAPSPPVDNTPVATEEQPPPMEPQTPRDTPALTEAQQGNPPKQEAKQSWLNQFEATVASNIPAIEKVVFQGLTEVENALLIQFAAKLVQLATVHDDAALSKVAALV